MPIHRTRRPTGPWWANQTHRTALGLTEHTSPAITAPLPGQVHLARTDRRRPGGTWTPGPVHILTNPDNPDNGLSEADALHLADQLTETAAALTGLVQVARRLPGTSTQ